ncbi:MAG: haloacid dehalogenase-like hydrolase [Deltaproteobacteria bacterium]|nr:haloacid dehalogenase-like hydrolase [Deltaproteobacteria bacterium]
MLNHDLEEDGRGRGWAAGRRLSTVLMLTLAFGGCVDAAEPTGTDEAEVCARDLPVLETTGWFAGNRERINAMIEELGRRSPTYDPHHRPVATLDWDNTITKNDTGDRFTFYMINHDKILQPRDRDWANVSPHLSDAARAALLAACGGLAEPGQPLSTSTSVPCANEIYSAYLNGKTIAGLPAWKYATVTPYAEYTYMLTAQIMAGYKPHEIREFAEAAMAEGLNAPVGATTTVGSFTDNGWIRIYDQSRELISVLQDNGFDVWIVTASPQLVVEAVADDLVGVPRNHVIGIRQLVEHGRVTADTEGCGPVADGENTLITFDEGKRCWINKVIFHQPVASQLAFNPDPSQRQVFAAGDSDTDIAFVKDATVLKLALDRGKVQLMCNALSNHGDTWLFQPMFISPRARRTTPYACSTARDARGNLIVDEVGQPIADQLEPLY